MGWWMGLPNMSLTTISPRLWSPIIGFMSTPSISPRRRLYEPEAGDSYTLCVFSLLSVLFPAWFLKKECRFMGPLCSDFLDFRPVWHDQVPRLCAGIIPSLGACPPFRHESSTTSCVRIMLDPLAEIAYIPSSEKGGLIIIHLFNIHFSNFEISW